MKKRSDDDLGLMIPWEFFCVIPGIILFAILLVQRNLIYRKARYGIFDENTGPLLAWALVAAVIILATKPWDTISRYGSQLRMGGVLICKASALFIILAVTPWGRYQTVRFETLYLSFGVSHYHRLVGWARTNQILDDDTGPYILQDKPLLEKLASEYGEDYLTKPEAARLVYGALRKLGAEFETLWEPEGQRVFFLACLQAEANPQPWVGIEWAQELVAPSEDGGVLEPAQRRTVCEWFYEHREEWSFKVEQSLAFVAVRFPTLLKPAELDLVMEAWAGKFKTLESLAIQGLLVREDMKALVGEARSLKTYVRLEGYGWDETMNSSNIRPFAIPQMVLCLIRSCGVELEEVEEKDAELVVTITLSSKAIYDYDAPVYSYETYYEYRNTRVGKYGSSSSRVPKQRQVRTGSETKTQFGAVISLDFHRGEKELKIPETLLYWHHVTYDHEKKRYLDAGDESLYGRIWPFGFDEDLFRFPYVTRYRYRD